MKSLNEQSEYYDYDYELETCMKYVKTCLEQERKNVFNKLLPFPLMTDFFVDRNWIRHKAEENIQEYTFPDADFFISDAESD